MLQTWEDLHLLQCILQVRDTQPQEQDTLWEEDILRVHILVQQLDQQLHKSQEE